MRSLEEIQRDNRPLQASLVTVGCKDCGGTGRRALTRTEWTTLDAVTFAWSPTSEIRGRLGGRVKVTALANRLANLERLGLVEHQPCETHGTIKEWRRIR